jgi:hypothetical protein
MTLLWPFLPTLMALTLPGNVLGAVYSYMGAKLRCGTEVLQVGLLRIYVFPLGGTTVYFRPILINIRP